MAFLMLQLFFATVPQLMFAPVALLLIATMVPQLLLLLFATTAPQLFSPRILCLALGPSFGYEIIALS